MPGKLRLAERVREASTKPVLATWIDDIAVATKRRNGESIPDDSHLVAPLGEVYREQSEQFAPLESS